MSWDEGSFGELLIIAIISQIFKFYTSVFKFTHIKIKKDLSWQLLIDYEISFDEASFVELSLIKAGVTWAGKVTIVLNVRPYPDVFTEAAIGPWSAIVSKDGRERSANNPSVIKIAFSPMENAW